MKRPIGYYVHHHGAGHRHRARLVAAALDRPCTLLGTFGTASGFDAASIVDLPDDWTEGSPGLSGIDHAESKPEAFHFAPVGVSGLRNRMAMIAAWIDAHDPAMIVVDVSVEVALFARLMTVPTAVVRLAGSRIDIPHLEAFRAADTILAPFPAIFEAAETPKWVRDKTYYGGFLALPAQVETGLERFPLGWNHPSDKKSPFFERDRAFFRSQKPSTFMENALAPVRNVTLVLGQGGTRIDAGQVAEAARATPDVEWHVYGPMTADDGRAPNLIIHGWQPAIGEALAAADIIIGGAGDGLLAEVAVRAKRFVCIPEDRPFHEQRDKARALAGLDLAIVLESWPDPEHWPAILRQASGLDPLKLHRLTDPRAIEKFAAAIETAAGRYG